MTRSILARMCRSRRRPMSHRVVAQLEGLETRNLLTGGTVVQTGALVTVNPATTGPNTAIVSDQSVNGVMMLDVNVNGTDHEFNRSQVVFVYYKGASIGGVQTFENETSLHTVAWGGSGTNLFVSSTGPDEFFGGSGSNTFDAGSGYDEMIGGAGTNVFNESATGSGVIFEVGSNNLINTPPGASGYTIL